MRIFISGGCKSGKSDLAQKLAVRLADGGKLYYVATMIASDCEDEERIAKHVDNRAGMGFETIECGRDLISCLMGADKNAVFLVDSVTALLSNEMFPPEGFRPEAGEKTEKDLAEFARSVKNAVFVSDYIFSDGAVYDSAVDTYMRGLAHAGRVLSDLCGTVIEAGCGGVMVYKGELEL